MKKRVFGPVIGKVYGSSPFPLLEPVRYIIFKLEEYETQFFPMEYSFIPKEQKFHLSNVKNQSEADIWNLIKRYSLHRSVFKGRFIGLRRENETHILSLSEFKVFIDQIDELKEDLIMIVVKEKYDDVFSTIQSRINQLSLYMGCDFTPNSTLSKDAAFNSSVMEGNTTTKVEFENSESEEDGMTHELKEIRVLRRMHDRFQIEILNGKVYIINEELLLREHEEMAIALGEDARGKFRNVNVYIKGSSHSLPPHERVSSLIHNVLNTFNSKIARASSLEERIKAAVFIHYEIVNIHPFRDYNGRMARYIMNMVLYQYCKIPPIAIMPGIKEEYFAAIREIDKNSNYHYLTTIVAESIIRSLDKALYYNQILDGMGLILKNFSLEMLSEYCKCNDIPSYRNTKSEMISLIIKHSQRAGEFGFLLELGISDLQAIVQDPTMSFSDLQSCVEKLLFTTEYSNMKSLLETLDDKILDRFLVVFKVKDVSPNKKGKIKDLLDKMLVVGMRTGLSLMTAENIVRICNDLTIDWVGKSKIENIYSIIGTVHAHYVTHFSKEDIWGIKKGITLEKLNEFNYLDLVNYAEKQELEITYQSKHKMCHIILRHLEQDRLKRTFEEISQEDNPNDDL